MTGQKSGKPNPAGAGLARFYNYKKEEEIKNLDFIEGADSPYMRIFIVRGYSCIKEEGNLAEEKLYGTVFELPVNVTARPDFIAE